VRGSDFPPEAQALADVGDAAGLDFERILALRPDLVLAADPDAIIIGSEAEDAGSQGWQRYPYLKSVRTGAMFTVSADLITRQTPRVLDAAEKICADPDTVRDRNPTSPHPSTLVKRAGVR
jgi:iron complex transport system substrate-binding protein